MPDSRPSLRHPDSRSGTAATGDQEFRASVKRDVEVVDLNGDRLAAAGNGETRLVLSGDRDGLLLVRVHGRSVHLRHVGFSVEGGLDPSHIVFFFPDASDLEISESGGARGDDGTTWNIPGSIIAPDASVTFAASTVTGQLFADSIMSVPGLPEWPGGSLSCFAHGSSGRTSISHHNSYRWSIKTALLAVPQPTTRNRSAGTKRRPAARSSAPDGCLLVGPAADKLNHDAFRSNPI